MKLVPVTGSDELLSAFCRLPHELYKDEDKKYAMNELHCRKLLSINFPLEKEAFLIQNDSGKNIGRILFQRGAEKDVGHWSFLCLPDYLWPENNLTELKTLMDQWFLQRGIKRVVGPYYLTTYFPYRMRIDSDPVSYAWEPKQPYSEYLSMKNMGHELHEIYYTNFLEGYGQFGIKGKKELDHLLAQGFIFREIDTTNLESEIRTLYEMSMVGFTDNYLFTPIPYELFRELYVPSFKNTDLRMSSIQFSPDGKPAGFNFTFREGDKAVIKSVVVQPDFRGIGLFNASVCHGILRMKELHPDVKDVVTALVHAKNEASTHVANSSGTGNRHEYALLIKELV